MACLRTQLGTRKMDEKRGKTETIILSSSEEEEIYDDDSEQQFSDSDEPSESDDTEIDDEEEDDRDEPTGSDHCDVDDESLSEKVVSLLQGFLFLPNELKIINGLSIKFIEFSIRFFRWKGYRFSEIKRMQSLFTETWIEACGK